MVGDDILVGEFLNQAANVKRFAKSVNTLEKNLN